MKDLMKMKLKRVWKGEIRHWDFNLGFTGGENEIILLKTRTFKYKTRSNWDSNFCEILYFLYLIISVLGIGVITPPPPSDPNSSMN